jgi:nucleoside-diphosphate-sugar epimerase
VQPVAWRVRSFGVSDNLYNARPMPWPTGTALEMTPIEILAPERGSRRNAAVLITGAGGEVGHGLIHALASAEGRSRGGGASSGQDTSEAGAGAGAGAGGRIVAIDIRELDKPIREMCRETFVGDICDSTLLTRLLAIYEITEIYHLAALLSTRAEYTPETAHDVNVGGTLNLLKLAAEQARSHGRRVKFVFPSSIAVYGLPDLKTKTAAGAVQEDEFCTPHTMYGCNKLYCEHLGRYYAGYYRWLAQDRVADLIDFRSIRFPGLISSQTLPSGGTSDFAPEMIHAAAAGRPYTCFVRPDTRIPFMTMPDAIEALLQLAQFEGPLPRCVYNISGFSPTAGEVRRIVAEHFPGAEDLITFKPDLQRQAIVDSWPADVDDSAARRDWGFRPRHDLRSAFEECLVPEIRARYA